MKKGGILNWPATEEFEVVPAVRILTDTFEDGMPIKIEASIAIGMTQLR
jgi:hypothetical protein